MSRTKRFVLNSFFTVINRVIILIVGLFIPRIILLNFGSNINGLISSINQFVNYFNIVEAGLASASIVALFKPLAQKDIKTINSVLSATKKYYYQAGHFFLILLFFLGLFYPLTVSLEELSNLEVTILVFVLGFNGVLNFYSLAKYRALLTASQRVYVVSISSTIYTVFHTLIIYMGIKFKYSITLIYAVSIIAMILRNVILSTYVKIKFANINFNARPDFNSLKNRWDALIIQFNGLAQNSAPILIITLFMDLSSVSIYAIYNMVILAIQGILSVFSESLSSGFGDLIASNETEKLIKTYNEFEIIFLSILCIVYTISFNLITPFISLYTSGINDVNYYSPLFGGLMILGSFFNLLKTPQGMLINAAGHFKETKIQATIQALIIIIGGFLSVPYFGLIGMVVSIIISHFYRLIDVFLYVPKNILNINCRSSFKNYFLMLISIIISQLFLSCFIVFEIFNFKDWLINAIIIFFITLTITLCINLCFNYSNIKHIYKRFTNLFKL